MTDRQLERIQRFVIYAVAIAGAIAGLLHWAAVGQPVEIAAAPADRLPCVSYAPYHRPGQSPLVKGTIVSRSQIDADLAQIAKSFRCVRTYSVDQGLSEVPALARKHGLRVLLGLWIGPEAKDNDREIVQGIAVLKRDADVINAVIVGNEVLLRRDQPAPALAGYLRRVRAATSVAVTYADVWEFWLRHPEILAETTFVTVHILPYWEDHPIPAERAVDHVLNVYALVRESFPGKHVLIGETGWPSAGRQREGALPSLVNQANFIRNFARVGQQLALDYNLVEAYDQPWKRKLEGTVGGYWGYFDAKGVQKYSRTGPVAENTQWQHGWIAAGVAAAVFVLLATTSIGAAGLLLMIVAGVASGAALWQGALDLSQWARNSGEMIIGGGYIGAAALASFFLARALAGWADGITPAGVPASVGGLLHWFMTDESAFSGRERALGSLRFLLLVCVAAICLLLLAEPRYRDFPVPVFIVPAIGYALLAMTGGRRAASAPGPEECAVALLVAITAAGVALQEGWQNGQAMRWCSACLIFAMSVIGPWLGARARSSRQA